MNEETLDKALDLFPICGCGMPEEVAKIYIAALQTRADWHKKVQAGESPGFMEPKEMSDWPKVAKWMLWYVLDHLDLTEHGGNAMGCWPTDKGHKALEELS